MSKFSRLSVYHNFAYYSESLVTNRNGKIQIPLQKTIDSGYINIYHLKDNQLHPLTFVYHPPYYSNPDKTDAIVIDEDGNKYEGKYIKHSDRAVTIATNDNQRQIISDYRNLTLNNVNNSRQPYIVTDLSKINEDKKTLVIEVILNGVTWTPKYKMVVKEEDDDNNHMSTIPVFQLVAEIDNTTDHDFEIDILELVAGHVNKPTQPRPVYRQAALMTASYEVSSEQPVAEQQKIPKSFQELHRYSFTDKDGLTLENGKSAIPLMVSQIEARKLYYVNFGNPGQDKLTVRYGYNFDVEDMFLPEGEAMVYSYKDDYTKESNPIGSVHVPETQPHREVNLMIGPTNRVQVKSRVDVKTEKGYDVLPDVVPVGNANIKDIVNKLDLTTDEKDKLSEELMSKLHVRQIEKVYYDHNLDVTNDTSNQILLRLSFYKPIGQVQDIEFSVQSPKINKVDENDEESIIHYFVTVEQTKGEQGYKVNLKYTVVKQI